MSILRRIRGVIGTALVWGVASAPLGVVWAFAEWLRHPTNARGEWIALPSPLGPMQVCAVGGVLAGVLFAALLSNLERRRVAFSALSRRRFAVFGGMAGLALPLLYTFTAQQLGIASLAAMPGLLVTGASALVGASISTATLRLAQRESLRLETDAELPLLESPDT